MNSRGTGRAAPAGGESFLTRLRKKFDKGNVDAEGNHDEDGNPERELTGGLPAFLDKSNPDFTETVARFREYLKNKDAEQETDLHGIADDVLNGEGISAEDFKTFTAEAAAFKERWEAAAKLAKRVTPEMVQGIAKMSGRGDFGTLAYVYGTNNLVEVWKKKIPLLVVNDQVKFDSLNEALNRYDHYVRNAEEQVKERAERLGIRQDVYEDIVTNPNKEERREKLREALDKKYDKDGSKIRKFFSYAGMEADKIAKSSRAELEANLAQIDEQIGEIGEILVGTTENEDVQDAILSKIEPVKAQTLTNPAPGGGTPPAGTNS